MTLKEIARQLGVSASTVSKALNNATDVSEKTRQRINEYAQSVGFTVHPVNSPKRICLLLENMDSHNNLQIGYSVLGGFQNAANQYNYEVVVEHCSDKQAPNLEKLCSDNNFIAFMVIGTKLSSPIMQQLETTKIPVMLMDSTIKNPKVSCISSDNINPIVQIVEKLAADGHRRIGFLGGELNSVVSRERHAGYIIGLESSGIDYDSSLVKYGNFTEEGGTRHAQYFIDKNVTAVVCASDLMAIGLIRGLKKLNKAVPEDISVSGFDDLDIASFFSPALTTVKQDFFAMGQNAFTILRQSIKGYVSKRVTMYAEPVFRNSTGIAGNQEID